MCLLLYTHCCACICSKYKNSAQTQTSRITTQNQAQLKYQCFSLFYEKAEILPLHPSIHFFVLVLPRAYKFIPSNARGVVGYASARMRRSMLSHWWITVIYSNGFKSFFPQYRIHRPENPLFNCKTFPGLGLHITTAKIRHLCEFLVYAKPEF